MDVLVSIIIPLYNAERFIGEAISSVIAQSHQNWELIIVDDGSTDGSVAVAKGFDDRRITIVQQENKGASAARNHGLRLAKGDFIQFLDADDYLSPQKIELQLNLIGDTQDTLALCPTIYFNDGEDPLTQPVRHEWYRGGDEYPVEFLLRLYGGPVIGHQYGGMIQPNAWLIPATVARKAGNWNESLTLDDDGEYFCRVVLACNAIRYAKKSINYYRRFAGSGQLSGSNDETAYDSAFRSTLLKYEHLEGLADEVLLNTIFSRALWSIAITLYPKHMALYRKVAGAARKLSPIKPSGFYTHTPVYRFVTALFGWKTSAWLAHLKHGRSKT